MASRSALGASMLGAGAGAGTGSLTASTTRRGGGTAAASNPSRPILKDAANRDITPLELVPTREPAAGAGGDKGKASGVRRTGAGAGGASLAASASSQASNDSDSESVNGMSTGGFSQGGMSDDAESLGEPDSDSDDDGKGGGGGEDEDGDGGGGGVGRGAASPTHARSSVTIVYEADHPFPGHAATPAGAGAGAAAAAASASRVRVPESVLDTVITITLQETDTTILFGMPSMAVQTDTVEWRDVSAANERYANLLTTYAKSAAELFSSRGVSTLNPPTKTKDVQTQPPTTASVELQLTSFDLDDTATSMRTGLPPAIITGGGVAVDAGSAAAGGGGATARGLDGSGAGAAGATTGATVATSSTTTSTLTAKLEAHIRELTNASLSNPGCTIDADASVRILPPGPVGGAGAGAGGGGMRTSAVGIARSGIAGGNLNASTLGRGGLRASMVRGSGINTSAAGGSAAWGGTSQSTDASGTSRGGGGGAGGKGRGAGAGSGATETKGDGDSGAGSEGGGGDAAAIDIEAGVGDTSKWDVATVKLADRVMASRSLVDALSLMERAIQQNLYHEAHRRYRAPAGADLVERLLYAGATSGHSGAATMLRHLATGGTGVAMIGTGGGSGASSPLATGPGGRTGSPIRRGRHGGHGAGSSSDGDEDGDDDEGAEGPRGRFASVESGVAGGSSEAPGASGGGGSGIAVAAPTATNVDLGDVEPGLAKLWSYWCPLVEGMQVSGMSWNKANRDLLAVSYGSLDYVPRTTGQVAAAKAAATAVRHQGLIALWSISNPEFPQAVLKTPDGTGVTSIAFATLHPTLLAAGLSDGTITIYDVRRVLLGESDGSPSMTSDKLLPGAHSEAVWQVKWVCKPDMGEVLVSIATDGRVTEWDHKKGLVPTLLMTLKRARSLAGGVGTAVVGAAVIASTAGAPAAGATGDATPGSAAAAGGATGGGGGGGSGPAVSGPGAGAVDIVGLPVGTPLGEGLLSQFSSGLTVDFVPTDTTLYYVGTEDGTLARCSTSYTEQYLDVVHAHTAPINKARLSPFIPTVLLTCSADWSVKLWRLGGSSAGGASQPASLTYTVDGVQDAVMDVIWSPTVSTIFAAVTRDGHVQLWELGSLTPLVDAVVTVDAEMWRAKLAAEAADRAAKAAQDASEARRKRRAELGYDEEDEEEERQAMAAAVAAARMRVSNAPGTGGGDGGDVSDDEGAAGGDKSGGGSARAPGAAAGAGRAGEGGEPASTDDALNAPPPRKRLTSVLFAETNTHILLTGDATGRVDVYRIVGLDAVLDVAGGGGGGGGGVDAAGLAMASSGGGGETGAAAAMGGGAAYEAQLTNLQAVLATMAPASA